MKYFLFLILIFFFSCKSMRNNDYIIRYGFISPKSSFVETLGDFQKIALNTEDDIGIMPSYFRNYGSLQSHLVVRIRVDKKYSFENFGSVTSTEFGNLKTTRHEWLNESQQYDDLLYTTSLKYIEVI